jgi:hypothetical protein
MEDTAAQDILKIVEENDDVFMESNSSRSKESRMFLNRKVTDDPTKLSPVLWCETSRQSSNPSNHSGSRPPSCSSQTSLSPFRRLSLSSSLLSCPSPSSIETPSNLMGSLEIIFGSHSSPTPPLFTHLTFLGQIYRSTFEKQHVVEK